MNIKIGKEAIEATTKGFKIASQAIRLTYGPKGSNAVIENDFYPFHTVANDAQTIVQAIHLKDPFEKRGLGFLKELMDKSNKDSGDGRKTTAIIAEEILNRGYSSSLTPIELKKTLDKHIPFIEKQIDEQTKEITVEEVEAVATIAGENKELGKTLKEIYKHIGKEGIIHLESSGTYTTTYSFVDGVRFFDTGYLSPFMVHDTEAVRLGSRETRAVYENPTILVTKRKINSLSEINPLLKTLEKQGKKDLIIFTDDMDSGVASVMVKAHQEHVFNICIIKAPILWKQYVFEDFAKITGSTIVEDASGINYKNLQLSHLGTCDKIIIEKEETIVMSSHDISDHINELKAKNDIDSQLRLSWLQTKTAILRLGANSESELSYLRLKAADAINSSRLALQSGVVSGGGTCLDSIADSITETDEVSTILKYALKAPRKQIVDNGVTEPVGLDILDSARVVKNAVRNAISLSSTILTAPIVIVLPEKTAEQIAGEALQSKGLRF